MFIGHYGIALGARSLAPRTSLGTLAFGAQFLDELWPVLLLLGVEQARIVPGLMAASAIDFVSYPFSHSLAMAVVWALAIGMFYLAARRDRRGALVLGAVVASHWILDLPMHRPDLPLWPGSGILVGGGLWNSLALTLAVDLGVFMAGLVAYLRQTRGRDRIGSWGLWSLVAVLAVFTVANLFGPPPPDDRALAYGALGLWLFVPWMYWVDRHRAMRAASAVTSIAPVPACHTASVAPRA